LLVNPNLLICFLIFLPGRAFFFHQEKDIEWAEYRVFFLPPNSR